MNVDVDAMITKASYTLSQAAAVLETTVDRVVDLVKAGRLRARLRENLGTYLISRDALMCYIKEERDWGRLRRELRPRVLLVDRDIRFSLLIRAELERGLDMDTCFATSGSDVETVVQQNVPDLVAIHVGATLRHRDQVRHALESARRRHARLAVYYPGSPDLITADSIAWRHIAALNADAVVSVCTSVRPLVEAIRRLLAPSPKAG